MAVYDHNYKEISNSFLVHSVMSVHRYFDIVVSFKVVNGFLLSPELSSLFHRCEVAYPLREGRWFQERQSRTNFYFNSAGCRLIRLWNALPSQLRDCSDLGVLKCLARDWALTGY